MHVHTYVRTYIRTYVLVTLRNVNLHSFALICTHLHSRARNSCIMSTDDGGVQVEHEIETRGQGRTALLDNGGWGGDSTAGPLQRTCFVELSAECI